jgi:hypothetical protein
MNLIFELIHYGTIVLFSLIFLNQYMKKMKWKYEAKNSLIFILVWRSLMFGLMIVLSLLFNPYSEDVLLNYIIGTFYPYLMLVVIFFANFFLGVKIFRVVYKSNPPEFNLIIYTIVIVDILIDVLLFYLFLIPESLVLNFNL